MKDCPKCKLINPPSALRCDCGYDFGTGQMKQSYLTERDQAPDDCAEFLFRTWGALTREPTASRRANGQFVG